MEGLFFTVATIVMLLAYAVVLAVHDWSVNKDADKWSRAWDKLFAEAARKRNARRRNEERRKP